jgi:coenzyme PQQ precursor peptide PqqA
MEQRLARWETPDFEELTLGLEVTAYISTPKPIKLPVP